MSKARRRRQLNGGFSRRQMIVAGVCGVGLYGGLSAYMMTRKPTRETKKKIGTNRVILFDNSDKYSNIQAGIIRSELITNLKLKLQYGDRLTLYQLTDDPAAPLMQRFSAIAPKRGVDIITGLGDPHDQEKIWLETFWKPYADHIEELCEPRTLKLSPILEGVYEISREFPFVQADQTEFTLVSDCLENASAQVSIYNGTLYSGNDLYWQAHQAKLAGVDCRVLYMMRRDKAAFQTKQHRQWLHDYLQNCQAKSILIDPV